jgi:hypothetical protein
MGKDRGSFGITQSIAEPVVSVRTRVVDGPSGPRIELIASMGAGSDTAMQMDVEVARSLAVQLRDTLEKMNRPLRT